MSGSKKIVGRGQGGSHGGGRGKEGGKEDNKKKSDGAEGKAGGAEGDSAKGAEGTQEDAGAGPAGQMGLGPTENRIEGDHEGAESQKKLEQESDRKIKRRGGVNPMGTMPPGWKPPQGPPGGAAPPPGVPPPGDVNMEEEKKAAEGEGAGDAVAGGAEDMPEGENQRGDTVEPGEDQFRGPEGDGGPAKGRRTFFSHDWVAEVRDAQVGKASKRPVERAATAPMDRKKLMLHMDWDETTLVLQNEKYLTMAQDDRYAGDAQVSWQALLAMNTEGLREWMKKQDPGGDVIMVVEQKELALVWAMQRDIHLLQPEGLGVLVLLESEASLFPKVSDIIGGWPWRMKRVSRFERQLQYTDGTKRWAIAIIRARQRHQGRMGCSPPC